jgi:hypothetical protein
VSDTLRRRIAAGLLIVGVVVAVLAIEDVGPFSDPVTEEQRVQSTVERFFGAASEGDSKTFCDLLTSAARQALEVSTAQRLQTDQTPECTKILDVLAPVFKDSQVSVRYVSVSGNRARVEARYRVSGSGAQPRTVLLLDEDGIWRISDPG